MDKSAGEISITLDMESSKMQLQLRAIAKHTEALAEELKRIDEEVCPECGSTEVVVNRLYGDIEKHLATSVSCNQCGYGKS